MEDVDDLSGESEEEAAPLPRKSKPRKTPSLLSTDEIPIYQDLADDEDLREPEIRREAWIGLYSKDDLSQGMAGKLKDSHAHAPAPNSPCSCWC